VEARRQGVKKVIKDPKDHLFFVAYFDSEIQPVEPGADN